MSGRESVWKGSRHDHDKENCRHYLRKKCLFVIMLLQRAILAAQPAIMESLRNINIILHGYIVQRYIPPLGVGDRISKHSADKDN